MRLTTLTTAITAFSELPAKLPPGYAAAALTPDMQSQPLSLCVVVRTEQAKAGTQPGLVGGPFVLVRETLDARVYLGCICDAAGRVQRWLEIWVQDPQGLNNAAAAFRDQWTNTSLDEVWQRRCEAFDRIGGAVGAGFGSGGIVRTGWEKTHPAPMLIDVRRCVPVLPKDPKSGAMWMLCEDDGALHKKNAAPYSTSLSRQLWQPELGDDSVFLPQEALGSDAHGAAAAMGFGPDVAALNPCGGLMMVQPYCPLSYEQYLDSVSGATPQGHAADALVKLLAASAGFGQSGSALGGWLMLSGVGRSGRLVEALHLKVMLLASVIGAVRAATGATQMPMLNITSESFRVRMAEGLGAAPLWWTARGALVQPGESVELPLKGTEARYFVSGRGGGVSIYSAAATGRVASGRGDLRLVNVLDGGTGTILEGTLRTQERVEPGKNDLVWLRFTVGAQRVDLYATLDAQQAMSMGELRVRTIPHKLSEEAVMRIRAALGVPMRDVQFELVPLISTPADMYSLGVLGVRTLLVDGSRTLPVALDQVFSLAFEAAKTIEDGEELPARIARVLESDPRWDNGLGPQRLLQDDIGPEEAYASVPKALWCRVLAALVRMFTGLTPDARCKDLGDAPVGGVHRVFDTVQQEFYGLLVSCRSLIVADHRLNAEIREVVDGCLAAARR